MVLTFASEYAIIQGMKLYYDRKSSDPTYFIQQGVRNGKKTTTRNIKTIGKHSELLKITDDPLAYAAEEVKKINEEYKKNKSVPLEMRIDFLEKIKENNATVSESTSLNIGYLFLQKIYHELDIESFFEKATTGSRITYDPNLVNRFITCSRILFPDSKLSTLRKCANYYEQPKFTYDDILRTMDILEYHYDDYLRHLFERSCEIVKRNTAICYYDCTNYYCEIEIDDEDYTDPVTGEFKKGLRKYGASKEHRPNPIVEMGLFMDTDGIPISMCIASGSDNEQTTAIPLEKEIIKMFKGKEFIYCSDGGLGSYNIRNFNSMGGRKFVVTQSIKKMSDPLKEAVFDDFEYKLLSTDAPVTIDKLKKFDRFAPENRILYEDRAYKILDADKSIDLGLFEEKEYKNGRKKMVKSKASLKQKIIVTFSRKMMEYQRYIRNRQVERAKSLLQNLDPETYKKGPNDVTRFIKRTSSTKSGEKVTDKYEIDTEAIEKEEKYDGYYAVATNLDDDAKTVLAISEGRNKIEECFRIMKSNFDARPIYHRKEERITAHFMVCFTALLIYRILEVKLDKNGTHFTVDEVLETLRNMSVTNLSDVAYSSTYTASKVCTALNAITGLELDRKYYKPKELNKKIRQIS